jgi:flagellar hook protein FlgE
VNVGLTGDYSITAVTPVTEFTARERLKLAPLPAERTHMNPVAIALQGLQQADTQLDTAAARIAGAGASSPDGANLDVVGLSAEMVALMSAKNLFSCNLATLKTADQMQKSLINLTA